MKNETNRSMEQNREHINHTHTLYTHAHACIHAHMQAYIHAHIFYFFI